MRINVRVVPHSSKNELSHLSDGTYKAWLTAPPTDGKANEALVALLGKEFNVSRSNIKIIRGLTSRTKVVEISSL